MSAKTPKAPAEISPPGPTWAEQARAKSRAALDSHLDMIASHGDEAPSEFSNIPPELSDWIFSRCGIAGSKAAEAFADRQRAAGWVDAPPEVGHSADAYTAGTPSRILCIAPDEHRILTATDRARTERTRPSQHTGTAPADEVVGILRRAGRG